jgi:hypothetical protein
VPGGVVCVAEGDDESGVVPVTTRLGAQPETMSPARQTTHTTARSIRIRVTAVLQSILDDRTRQRCSFPAPGRVRAKSVPDLHDHGSPEDFIDSFSAVNPARTPNSIPVYRFYNMKDGCHEELVGVGASRVLQPCEQEAVLRQDHTVV